MTQQQRLEQQHKKILALQAQVRRAKASRDLWKHRYHRDVPKWRG